MADESQQKVDKEIARVEKQINAIYGQAQIEIEQKIKEFDESFKTKKDIYYQKYKNHEITQTDYNAWRAGQLFQKEQWNAKRDQICGILHNANAEAVKIVNGGTISAFAEGANWTAYSLEHGEGVNFGFGLYDSHTVTSLIKDNPQILPKWKIDEPKEYVWNKQKVNNCVTQGIIQGESVGDVAKRIATVTSNQNKNLALTHAQTAMGGAQNAGRMERLQEAKKMGINVVKEWMATLDGHTRDSHQEVDGEQQPVGDKWHPMKFSNGCRYPCDPLGPAHEVFNCRCTLVGDVTDYPEEYQRYDNIDGKPIENMTYKEWEKLKNADVYKEQEVKEKEKEIGVKEKEIDALHVEADELQEKIEIEGADYEFKNIWYNKTVTYADWEDVKDSIPSKIEYFENAKVKATENVLREFGFSGIDEATIEKAQDELFPALTRLQLGITTENDLAVIDSWLPNMSQTEIKDTLTDTTWFERYSKFDFHIKELNMFQNYGEEYSKLLAEQKELKSKIAEAEKELKGLNTELNKLLDPTYTEGPFGTDAYSQERKDAALWAQSAREADNALRGYTGEVWQHASSDERRAAYNYTSGSGGFNRPLRGYDGSWYSPKGIGNVSLNNEGRAKDIENLTNIINKCELPTDTWLQRGVDDDGLAGFLDIPADLIRRGSQEDLEKALLGKEISDPAFMSCGSSKGQGFGGNIINIYCPEGTKAIYCEPFSAYGRGDGSSWDGKSKQSSFGSEDETLLQRNTYFRIVKVEKSSGVWSDRLYVDVEVIDQRPDEIKYN